MTLRHPFKALIPAIMMLMPLGMTACDQAIDHVEVLMVTGMHCEACADGIQQTVTGIEGIDSCEASFENGEVNITCRGTDTMALAIKRIEAMGFTVNQAR